MSRLTTLPIRTLLLLITFVVALPAAGIILYSGIQFRNVMLDDARQETLKLADRIVSEQQNLVVGAEQLMTALAQFPEVKGHDAARVEPILRELRKLNPMYSNIFIADREGTVWATAVTVKPPFVVADRRYFRNALTSGRLSSGEYVISRATSKPAFNIAYPLKDAQGAVIGVISIGLVIDRYRHLLEQMQMPSGTSFVLIDHRGIVLSRGINPEPYIGKPYPADDFRKLHQGPEAGTCIRSGFAGDKRIISYRKLRLAGEQAPYLYVTAGVPVAVATHKANSELFFNALLLFSCLALACAGAILIAKRSIADRIKLLEDASQRLAAGDLQVRVSALVAGGELGSLGRTFDTMAEELSRRESERKQGEQSLKISEENYRCFAGLTSDYVHKCSRNGKAPFRIQWMGGSVGSISGYTAEEIYERGCWLPLVHPDDRQVVASYLFSLVPGNVKKIEFRMVTKEGIIRWISETSRCEAGDEGGLVLFGAATDVTERKLAEEELQKKNFEIEQFIYTVSHDLRSPLVTVKTFLGYLEKDMAEGNQGQLAQDLQFIHSAADKMKLLLDELLEMSRIGRVETPPVRVSFREILAEALESLAGVIKERTVDIHLPDMDLMLFGDRPRLCQVWQNLIENAIKYSRDDSIARIELGLQQEGAETVFFVKDNGIGIDPQYHGRIFGIFDKLDPKSPGAGLGLSMIQRIVEKCGGRVWVESEGLGKGSCFFFTLPQALVKS